MVKPTPQIIAMIGTNVAAVLQKVPHAQVPELEAIRKGATDAAWYLVYDDDRSVAEMLVDGYDEWLCEWHFRPEDAQAAAAFRFHMKAFYEAGFREYLELVEEESAGGRS